MDWCINCTSFFFLGQVLADALTLGLMVYASVLEPEDSVDSDKLDLIYTGALLIQVRFVFVCVLGCPFVLTWFVMVSVFTFIIFSITGDHSE